MATEPTNDPTCERKPGRPRCETTHQAILDATMALMEQMPVRDLTIEGIARAAKVGKPTIYRWWDTKCALAMDAFFNATATRVPFPRAGSVTESICAQITALIGLLSGPSGRIIAEMIGEGQSQPDVMARFRERFFAELLAPARRQIEQGKRTGEIDPELDTELAIDLIYGPVYYRLLICDQPLDDAFAKALCKRVVMTLAG